MKYRCDTLLLKGKEHSLYIRVNRSGFFVNRSLSSDSEPLIRRELSGGFQQYTNRALPDMQSRRQGPSIIGSHT